LRHVRDIGRNDLHAPAERFNFGLHRNDLSAAALLDFALARCAPACSQPIAIARPMPWEAPITIAISILQSEA
jgi:hypothetical protein